MSFGISVRNGLAVGLLASTFLSSRSSRNIPASLILNFTDGIYRSSGRNYAFSDIITFTRSTTATFVGSNGMIQTAAINAPRFDYNPVTLAPNGLLIEEQRTNLMVYASDYTNAAWTKTDTTVASFSGIAPDSTNSATLLTQGTAGTAEVSQVFSITAGNTVTYSRYVKLGNARWYRIQIRNAGLVSFANAWFDLTNGVVGSTSTTGGFATLFGSTITNAGNGWFRLTFTVMIGATFATPIFAGSSVSADGSATPVNSATRYEWGNQVEVGAFATSYIPTVASTVTRAVDVALMLGSNFSSWYNQSEGTLFAQALTIDTVTGKYPWSVHNGTGTELIAPYFIRVNGGGFVVDGTPQVQIETGGLVTLSNIALAVKLNDFAMSINGNPVATDNSGTMPTPDQMQIGNRADGARTLNGHIRRITYYPSRLTNAQLQALTA